MENPALIIMAAGMGSRFGGLKQITPVGDNGEIIMDFSLYDAYQAGFRKVVFVIKKEREADFRAIVGSHVESRMDVQYVFQSQRDRRPVRRHQRRRFLRRGGIPRAL